MLVQARHYPVMCRFPLFVTLCDHNSPTLQTDRPDERTDVMFALKNIISPRGVRRKFVDRHHCRHYGLTSAIDAYE